MDEYRDYQMITEWESLKKAEITLRYQPEDSRGEMDIMHMNLVEMEEAMLKVHNPDQKHAVSMLRAALARAEIDDEREQLAWRLVARAFKVLYQQAQQAH